MAKNELQKMFDNIPDKSYREKVKQIEDYFISIADGVDVIGDGKEITYAEGLCDYKHSFADGIYIREMKMKQGQLGFSAVHRHSYGFFLLSGRLASSKEDGVEEFISPCYIISPQGAKRIVYAMEDCIIATVHANPTNTEDLDELAKINVALSWEEYDNLMKKKTKKDE